MPFRARTVLIATALLLAIAPLASAQDWSIDARDIALGGTGSVRPLVSTMTRFENDTVVVVPFGLFQVLRHIGIYNPKSSDFDPVRASAYVSSPIHFMFHRDDAPDDTDDASGLFSGTFSGAGVFNPRLGRVVPLSRGAADTFHGLYLGAGPYIGVRANMAPSGGDDDRTIAGSADEQLAAAFTMGYRGRFTFPKRELMVDVAVDYSYLRGVLLNRDAFTINLPTEDFDIPTEGFGQSTRSRSTNGVGFAINFATGVTFGHWGFGVGLDGLANRIRWKGLHETATVEFPLVETPIVGGAAGAETLVIHMPLDYRGQVSYADDAWTVAAGVGHRFSGGTMNAGVERRLDTIALRGGLRYDYGRWNPAAGVGLPLSSRVSLDVAAFGTSANVAHRRHLAVAFSFRIRAKSTLFTR